MNVMDLISLDMARQVMSDLKNRYYFRRESERVALNHSLGRELAKSITATKMSPEYDISTMDGYALHTDQGYPLRIDHRIYAGDDRGTYLKPGQAAVVATGAFLPGGANAVLKLEDAQVTGNMLMGPAITPWTHVLRAGTDYRLGDVVLGKDQKISPPGIALLYGLDVDEVEVYEKMKVGIISTGTELLKGMTRNTNAVMIAAFLQKWGCDARMVDTVPDDYDMILEIIRESASIYDVIITTGGVSVGERDHVHEVIKALGEMVFHKVKIRPGKPLAVGIVDDTPVFGLPGKPTGAFAALEVVVRHFFTDIPRPSARVIVYLDISIPGDGSSYLLFVKMGLSGTEIMGYEGSDLPLFSSEDPYDVSLVSASHRFSVVDGYAITDRDIMKGEMVTVHLFN